MTSASTLQIAEWLTDQRGLSVIPLDHPAETSQTDPARVGKVPRLATWKMFQETRATADNLRAWFGNGHPRNLGIVTGSVSAIVVIDCDSPEAVQWADTHLPATPMVTRTARGEHRFYRHPGIPVSNKARVKTGDASIQVDVRGDGGFVVGPTSVHASGVVYERVGEWPPVDQLPVFQHAWIEPAPVTAEARTATPPPAAGDNHAHILERARRYLATIPGAVQGHGGDTQTLSAACRIVRGFNLSDADALLLLRTWNTGCVPPWSEEDLTKKIRNAREYGTEPVGGLRDAPAPARPSRSRSTRSAPAPAPAPGGDDDPPFIRDAKTGAIVASALDNVRVALAALDRTPTYDEFRRITCIDGQPVTDLLVDTLWVLIIDTYGFRPSLDLLRRVITTEAVRHPVHPVRQYLEALVWDGTPRLDTWLSVYGGAEDTAYTRAVGALPLLAGVRRVRQPGCKFDELLVLEGPQGCLKSSALATLCPRLDWFSDDLPLGVDSKQVIERTGGRWILEAAELHGNRGRETEQIKAFLSRREDGPVRMAYERFATSAPRQFVIIGTTNSTTSYLKDSTGGRRFWPVRVTRFDVDALLVDRDQLWAEAATREAAGAAIRLEEHLWAEAAQHQEQRRAEDPWEDVLAPVFDGDGFVRPEIVLAAAVWDALGLAANFRDNRHADRVAAIAARAGFMRRKTRINGKPTWHWARTTDTGEAA